MQRSRTSYRYGGTIDASDLLVTKRKYGTTSDVFQAVSVNCRDFLPCNSGILRAHFGRRELKENEKSTGTHEDSNVRFYEEMRYYHAP